MIPDTIGRFPAPARWLEGIHLAGPVRQVDTAPTVAVSIDHMPHRIVIALIGGWCPADRSTATP